MGLRAMPELVILVKGMRSAARSVFFTLLLLLILLYVFAIAFTQLLKDTDEVGEEHFSNVLASMHPLWLYAALIDEITSLVDEIEKESIICVILIDVFILIASLTVMNMLISVLCEVINAVATSEREEMALSVVKSK